MDRASSHPGTPNGSLASITIGDVNGMMDPQKASWLSGASNA